MPDHKGTTMDLLSLEDLSVGQKFVSETYVMEEAEIIKFGSAYDPQPFHTQPDVAKETFFQGLAASGWHTAAVSMRLTVGCVPIAGGLVGANAECKWPRPTRAGDTLRVKVEITAIKELRSREDRGVVTIRSVTVNQNDDPVQVMVSNIVVMKRGCNAR